MVHSLVNSEHDVLPLEIDKLQTGKERVEQQESIVLISYQCSFILSCCLMGWKFEFTKLNTMGTDDGFGPN